MRTFVPLQKALGTCIYELRQRTGLKVEQLAEKSGLSGPRINAIERGEVNLNLGTLLLLAMALDTTVQEVFSSIAGKLRSDSEPRKARVIAFPKAGN